MEVRPDSHWKWENPLDDIENRQMIFTWLIRIKVGLAQTSQFPIIMLKMTISRKRNEIQKKNCLWFQDQLWLRSICALVACYDRMGNWLKFKPFKVHLTLFPHLKNNTGTRPKTVDESSRWIQCQPVVRTCWKVRSFSASLIGSGKECKKEKKMANIKISDVELMSSCHRTALHTQQQTNKNSVKSLF